MATTPLPETPDTDVITLRPSPWEEATRKADRGEVARLSDDTGEHHYVLMAEEQFIEALEDAEDLAAARAVKDEERIPFPQLQAEIRELEAQGQ